VARFRPLADAGSNASTSRSCAPLGEVERSPGAATDYALGRLEALRYSLQDAELRGRIDAAITKAKRARSKRKRPSATDMADAAVRKAFAKHGIDDDDEHLLSE
jgi:hypothetical protein